MEKFSPEQREEVRKIVREEIKKSQHAKHVSFKSCRDY